MFNLIGRALALTTSNLPKLEISTGKGIRSIIVNGISGILILAGAIAVVYLIYGGIQYTTAGGSPEQATKGKTTIINAIIGIVIIFVAIILVKTVTGILLSGELPSN